jgi:hypothetical protein
VKATLHYILYRTLGMFACSHATKLRFPCTKSENADVDKNTFFLGVTAYVLTKGEGLLETYVAWWVRV